MKQEQRVAEGKAKELGKYCWKYKLKGFQVRIKSHGTVRWIRHLGPIVLKDDIIIALYATFHGRDRELVIQIAKSFIAERIPGNPGFTILRYLHLNRYNLIRFSKPALNLMKSYNRLKPEHLQELADITRKSVHECYFDPGQHKGKARLRKVFNPTEYTL